jgi:hypothetical protein
VKILHILYHALSFTSFRKLFAGMLFIHLDFGWAPLLRGSPKTEAEEAMQKLNRKGLFHPMLFFEQEKREARFLQHVWTIRQRTVSARQTKN